MKATSPVADIARHLLDHQRFLVVSHARPDGDAIGSVLALGLALERAGKQAVMISADPVPGDYRHLPGAGKVRVVREAPEGPWDAAIILECNGAERTGVDGLEKHLLVNIDHHASALDYARFNWVDTSFGAVGQLVLRLLDVMELPVTPDVAANLYAALMTDTGNFQYSSTTAVELMDAARLVQCGARPAEIAEQVYHSFTPARIRLLGAVLGTLEIDPTERIAWVHMTREMLDSAAARPEDTEGIINQLMLIETVQLAAFFKQDSADRFKLSLRSKGALDVSKIAVQHQGGGHRNAAGFTVHAGLAEAKAQVIGALQILLNHQPG